jgi:hypothetical protein
MKRPVAVFRHPVPKVRGTKRIKGAGGQTWTRHELLTQFHRCPRRKSDAQLPVSCLQLCDDFKWGAFFHDAVYTPIAARPPSRSPAHPVNIPSSC